MLLAAAPAAPGAEERFPARPITLVVGFAAGGGIDLNARLLATELGRHFGQSVVVENRPGAGSRIANEYVARSAPDGYTLLIGSAAMTIDMAFPDKPGAQTLRELTPVSTVASTPMLLVVHPSIAARNVRELVAQARSRPGALNYGSSGPGTTGHLYAELFKLRTATGIVHIPYKGTAPALNAVIAGDVEMGFVPLPGVLAHVRAGRVRALATTGTQRSPVLPEVPTMAQAGFGDMEASTWYGVLAPAGTPPAIVDALARGIADVARAPGFQRQLAELGEEPAVVPTERFAALLHREVERWAGVVKAAGIEVVE
jgi:tripartite-type tricarboxylate transporter receptor subunit TctC